jgi:hypothetical protein
MSAFIVDVAAVVVGIAVFKWLEAKREELIWKWHQRHSSSSDPWDNF